MSTVTNKGANMYCKSVTDNFSTVEGLFVEPSTAIAKPKGSIEAFISIIRPSVTVTYTSHVIIDVVPDEVIWTINWLHYLDYDPIVRTSSTSYLVRTRNVLGLNVSSYGLCNGIPPTVLLFISFS